ncbi:MAG: hypothetical protein KGN76_00255 [Acidobacteriota bacterium]|nr:hypothetical protein [Acidobacteriota bacterium]
MPPERAPVEILDPPPPGRRPAGRPGVLVALILLVLTCAAALSINVVQTTYSPKGDEATYVAMALSLARDHDFSYDRRDLERFYRIYRIGPEGIFLKRGSQMRLHVDGSWPFVHLVTEPDPLNRIYFGKAFIYPLIVAPFVWVFGLNGMLLFHILLLAAVCAAGYAFAAAQAPRAVALVFALGFVGASIAPIYAVWLTPEIFNFAAVFLAYFFWFYKDVAPPRAATWWDRLLYGRGSDIVAAVLLGLATYSKPTNALLAGPAVLWLWTRRRFWWGLVVGVVFVAVTSGCFGVNALVTGEFNYMGGDRKTFYGTFPDEKPTVTFDNSGISMVTNDADTENVIDTPHFWPQLADNAGYFLFGRDAGFVPYYFPGAVVVLLWLAGIRKRPWWQAYTLLAVVASVVILLIFLPYTWGGGGGPPGNRYFLSLYPALFFLMPPITSVAAPLVAWLGGAAFVAPMLLNPFVASKDVWQMTEHGLVRELPVELTMVSDLPINLDRTRSHLFYSQDPTILLYLLDQNAWPPEVGGIWVAGKSRSDIIFRTDRPVDHVVVGLRAPIADTVKVSVDGESAQAVMRAGVPASLTFTPDGVYAHHSYSYLLRVSTANGFVPAMSDPTSTDTRYLGVFVTLTVTLK